MSYEEIIEQNNLENNDETSHPAEGDVYSVANDDFNVDEFGNTITLDSDNNEPSIQSNMTIQEDIILVQEDPLKNDGNNNDESGGI